MTTPTKPAVWLNDITLLWPNLDKTNTMSGKFQVDLAELTDEAVQRLATLGIVPREKEGKGLFITPKSKFPIVPVDADNEVFVGRVGNGSKAQAYISSYVPTRMPAGQAIRPMPTLLKLVITELVEYNPEPMDTADMEL
jgi:hypothetical protein